MTPLSRGSIRSLASYVDRETQRPFLLPCPWRLPGSFITSEETDWEVKSERSRSFLCEYILSIILFLFFSKNFEKRGGECTFGGISHVRRPVIESYRVRKLEQYGEDDNVDDKTLMDRVALNSYLTVEHALNTLLSTNIKYQYSRVKGWNRMGLVVNWPTNREVKPRKNVKTTCFVFTNIFIMNARYHFNAVLYIFRAFKWTRQEI